MQRLEFYKAKSERLKNKNYNRESKSIILEKRSINVCETIELSKIKTLARNAIRNLVMLFASNLLLKVDFNY